ncbi:beta-glucosidase [Methylobacterium sp. ARG-1]|nr:beta-glucosidase [Methylobacterium sp. ARG-1]
MKDQPTSLLGSVILGGFECSSHRRSDGRRLDLLASTGHDRLAREDYRALRSQGIHGVRDGLRWHLIETAPGQYDWSSFLLMLREAEIGGMRVAWDLCHYGWPDDIEIWSSAFVERFARFAAATARLVRSETESVPVYCTVNEISFWAWAGGDTARISPLAIGRGMELKRQLARASIAATAAIREVDPRARFLHAEPAIHVTPGSEADREAAEHYRLAQYEALDMVSGRMAPELGGSLDSLDIVGLNFYPDNQWVLGGGTIPLGHHGYRPFRAMLAETYARYGRPLLVSETGAEGTARASWLHYVCAEVRAALREGVPVGGICLYPVVDYPGWDNDRCCEVGLLSMLDQNGRRTLHAELAEEIARQGAALMHVRREEVRRHAI